MIRPYVHTHVLHGLVLVWVETFALHTIAIACLLQLRLQQSQRSPLCCFQGATDPLVYPLRARLKVLLESNRLSGLIRSHPGYWMRPFTEDMWTWSYFHSGINQTKVNDMENQVKDYASEL